MHQAPLLLPFFLASSVALFGTAFAPHLKLLAFAPFLAILYNRLTFLPCLWIASLCGLLLDLLSSEFRFGIQALNFGLTSVLLYQQKRHFVEDKPLALSLFTLLISVISTIVHLVLISLFDRPLPLSIKLFATDLMIMPLADAVYAFVWFSCPILLYLHIKKIGWRAFWVKITKLFRREDPAPEHPEN